MDILLDTHAFLWLTYDAPELSEQAKILFRDVNNNIYFSVVSAWEISVKYQLGKLPLPKLPMDFIEEQRNIYNITTLDLNESSIRYLLTLPNYHKDPFDRMLICQALTHDLTLLTTDSFIRQYPVKTIW
ncbi:hypothetical protein BegalDRAFT_2395 [Beggiatoa alba B18LD]|uniref:PIN domain-containing protein n=1 Tax=Beggiatoa alba B18LD TaxID=395493 RepID=I3CI03_9GAMM|nr:type II toxin-antitoxin system VapC family toxin [Beggiatoa alba]EIJ43246.1 hypothetical protein BegalDRAFT_2395 [Beggiatoa alba B18LD]